MSTTNKVKGLPWQIISLLAIILLLGYGVLIEPRWIEVTRWSRQVGLPGTPLKIVQLSDLHISGIGSTEQNTFEHLKALQPDLILLTGDVIDHRDSLPAFKTYLKHLPPSIKVAVLGNWEHWSGVDLKALAALYAENDVTLLVNRCISLSNHGLRLSIAGFDDYTAGQPNVDKVFWGCGKDEPIILAAHSPGIFEEMPPPGMRKPAFSLAGHTHGGQFAVGNMALFTPPGSGRFVAGWYQTQWGDLYVSKGVGTSMIPMRIGARPEIAFIEVK